jgi:TetR/AcrR family transcriptional regulator, tetracycline repressor protein
MDSSIETSEPPRGQAPRGPRGPKGRQALTRERILHAGLRVIDQEGLEALTVRRLAQDLGVDPMSLYRHFENKEALLTGLADALWAEVAVPDDPGWEAILRSLARSLRSVAHAHPQAYILLCQCPSLPTAVLCLFHGALVRLQQSGFERKRAAETLNAVLSYAMGYATMELAAQPLRAPTPPTQTPATDFERIAQVMRAIPRDTPPQLAEVAYLMCVDCDLDAQFSFGLDLMLTGLRGKQPE